MFETVTMHPTRESVAERVRAITSKLRAADALIAEAVELIGRGGIEAVTGLSPEMLLMFEGRRTYGEARTLTQAAATLHEMPQLRAAFFDGAVSWGQVRSIVGAISNVRVSDRAEIDAFIGERAPIMKAGDPGALVEQVEAEAERRRADLALAREDRAIQTSFLSIQARFDGGSRIYGEADAESTAVIVGALDAIAPAPVLPDDDGPSRAQQHMAALVAICESTLGGGTAEAVVTRPRPRLYATFDLAAMNDESKDDAMTLLTALAGRSPRLTSVSRDVLLCDSTLVPVIFDGSRPILVGDEFSTFSEKTRRAIIARDKRCRMCRNAPASWCDVHHLVPGVGNTADDGCLLCRTCHRRVHSYKWKMTRLPDGAIEFSRRGQKFLSLPP